MDSKHTVFLNKNNVYGVKFEAVESINSGCFYNKSLDLINYKFLRIAAKSHTCEMCGCEIHRGEHIWWYKPKPNYFKVNRNRKGFKTYNIWRKRCFNCEPLSYAELDLIMSREATQGGY